MFRALAHPARRQMLRTLAREPTSISDLARPHRMSLAAAAKHVHVLESAGLVRLTLSGRTRMCRIDAEPLSEAYEWIRTYERLWSRRLDALEALFANDDDEEEDS
ncbi:DNA-binding transcriptional regulator, ArsR family [Nonomuraea jiangxiensis]|uniref:DNA-binding transcriptional regulator, ArsR family n=1 Tax=Nonomuraea jiangxiensis TaxID=633440 RepID=A0A1G9N8J1_9ACTN|nr:DNA-binding transcriptional regulator, ArsR family [Nonomuraea jiangxiensis]